MIGETGERKSAVATPDGKSRKKKKFSMLHVQFNVPYGTDIDNRNMACFPQLYHLPHCIKPFMPLSILWVIKKPVCTS